SDSLAVTDSLSANHTLWAYIDLEITEPSVAGLAGWVRDTTWLGISNAVVEVWDVFPTGLVLFSTTSGLDGAFSLPAVPNGSYQLYAYKDHYYPTMIPVTAPDDSVIVILQPTPNPVPSSEWINLYCNENYFEGNLLPVGSVVEAYDQSGTICGQFFVHTVGAYGQMRVYRDDPNTPATDEGAEVGEVIEIRINTVPAVAWPIPTWTYHNDLQEVCLNTTIIETVCIDLNTGWNLISWNVDTYSDEIETVIADVIGCVDVVLGFESGSLTYDPDLPQFSTLDHVDHHHGYWFRMDCPGRLCVTGIPVDPQMPIDLETNWNLVSYLPNHQEDIEVALSSVMASLIVAHGFDGGAQSYEPAHPELATLTVLKPTFGYWLKTTAPATLIYPAMPPLTGCLSTDRGSMKAAPFTAGIIPTPEWVNVYGDNVTLDGVSLPAGTNLQMYDEEGTLCGQYHLINEGEVRFTPVYLDDKHSMIDEGADYGSEISIVVNGIRAVESFTWTAFGDRIRLGTLTSTTKAETMLPRKFELAQNYPNPFNPQTTIRFALPEAAPVKVEVFNLLGERVAGLIDELLPASDYAINWDGQLANGDVAPSGIYFYRLTTPQFSAARKMILLK
ncbi:MAG: T9SS type A sorting domain-containing protein, partial [candidate division Zixibacteria bacterium]|nr:T9SS type A sorting domain-containing protein [candidate division Zixibacteria bacterium]